MNQHIRLGARRHGASSAIAASVAIVGLALLGGGPTPVHSQTPKAADFAPQAEDPKQFPAGPGRDDTFYACSACHGFRLVAQQGLSRDRWNETLTYMTERHKMAEITGKDREVILDYLAAAYGPKLGKGTRGWRNPFTPQ